MSCRYWGKSYRYWGMSYRSLKGVLYSYNVFFQNSKLSFMLTSATIDRNLCNTGDKNKNLKIIDFVTSFSIYNGIKNSKHN